MQQFHWLINLTIWGIQYTTQKKYEKRHWKMLRRKTIQVVRHALVHLLTCLQNRNGQNTNVKKESICYLSYFDDIPSRINWFRNVNKFFCIILLKHYFNQLNIIPHIYSYPSLGLLWKLKMFITIKLFWWKLNQIFSLYSDLFIVQWDLYDCVIFESVLEMRAWIKHEIVHKSEISIEFLFLWSFSAWMNQRKSVLPTLIWI